MQDWRSFSQGIHDNPALFVTILLVAAFFAGWLVFETLRRSEDHGEIHRLRRRLQDLEIQRAHAYSNPGRVSGCEVLADPVVLTPRWVRRGGAATSSDGGCLVIVNDISEAAQKVLLTVRIDGLAVHTREGVRTGHSLQARGNMGAYTILVSALEPLQAMVSVSLRSRHAEAASQASVGP